MKRHPKKFFDLDTAQEFAEEVERLVETTTLYTKKREKPKSFFVPGWRPYDPSTSDPSHVGGTVYHRIKHSIDDQQRDVYTVDYATFTQGDSDKISVSKAEIITAEREAIPYLDAKYQELAPAEFKGQSIA